MQATISDIAKEAGVCIATVSRVMNSSDKVSEATRAKVEAAMKKFDYSPSVIARGLKSKSMKTIAIVVKSFTMLHHMRIAHEINSHFSKQGYDVIMFETGPVTDDISLFIKRMFNRSIDGFIFIGSAFQILTDVDELDQLFKNIPVVIANGWVEGAYGLLVDEEKGMSQMAGYLKEHGRRHIIYMECNDTLSSENKKRGFVKATEGMDDCKIYDATNTVEGIMYAVEVILSKEEHVDAIMCEEDNLAIKVIAALHRKGLNVPEDIAVTGFNDSEYATLAYPYITTVDNKAIEQGRFCSALLDDILSGRNSDEYKEKKVLKVLQTELVIRKST